jgi:hypothetical protein
VADAIHDETTISNFQHLLEEYEMTEYILKLVNTHLARKGLLKRRATQDERADGTKSLATGPHLENDRNLYKFQAQICDLIRPSIGNKPRQKSQSLLRTPN